MTALVKLAIDKGVAQLTLARAAKRNALTRELIGQLTEAVEKVRDEPAVRVVTLSAEGPAFCAGMDLDEMQQRAHGADAREQWELDARAYRDLLVSIWSLDALTLAVVQGPAVAGGFGIVLACDLVLASSAAQFALPEVKRGISPAVVSPLLLYRIGNAAAMPLLLAGQVIDGEQAYRLGLCQYLASPDRLDAMRGEIVTSLLQGAPQAIAMTKRLVRGFEERVLMDRLEAGMKVSAQARATPEAREGLAAFNEKRQPAWAREPRST